MNFIKSSLAVIATGLVLLFSTTCASAENIGVVNLDQIISNYSKAQDLSAELKVKEAELQKFLADAQKQLKDTTSPLDRKNLEEKLTAQFKTKSEAFRKYQVDQMQLIEKNIFTTIENVAKQKNLTLVLNQESVLVGGVNITDVVLQALNKK